LVRQIRCFIRGAAADSVCYWKTWHCAITNGFTVWCGHESCVERTATSWTAVFLLQSDFIVVSSRSFCWHCTPYSSSKYNV
jgi:hypothetical protein